MSDNNILQKYMGRSAEETTSAKSEEAEGMEDLVAFGWLRGSRERAVSLELRKKTGNIVAIGYSWIEKLEFDPSEGITIHALEKPIRIKGRNLNTEVKPSIRLFEGLCRQRVPYVQEADEPADLQATHDATIVERIDW